MKHVFSFLGFFLPIIFFSCTNQNKITKEMPVAQEKKMYPDGFEFKLNSQSFSNEENALIKKLHIIITTTLKNWPESKLDIENCSRSVKFDKSTKKWEFLYYNNKSDFIAVYIKDQNEKILTVLVMGAVYRHVNVH